MNFFNKRHYLPLVAALWAFALPATNVTTKSEVELKAVMENWADQLHDQLQELSKLDTTDDAQRAKNKEAIEALREKIRQWVVGVRSEAFRTADSTISSGTSNKLSIAAGASVGGGATAALAATTHIFVGNTSPFLAMGGIMATIVSGVGTSMWAFEREETGVRRGFTEYLHAKRIHHKQEALLRDYFWNRLRERRNLIPQGLESEWLTARLSELAEEAVLLYSRKALVREAARYKTAVRNLIELVEDTVTRKVLVPFEKNIPTTRRLLPGAQARRKFFDKLQESKRAFLELAQATSLASLRPLGEIVRMPSSEFTGVEDRNSQILRILGPVDSQTRTFISQIRESEWPKSVLQLIAHADISQTPFQSRVTHTTKLAPSKHIPLGIHELHFSFSRSGQTTIEGTATFSSAAHNSVELARDPQWKTPFLAAVIQALGKNAECADALIEKDAISPILPALAPISETATEDTGVADSIKTRESQN